MKDFCREVAIAIWAFAVACTAGRTWAEGGPAITSYGRASLEAPGRTSRDSGEILRGASFDRPGDRRRAVTGGLDLPSSRRLPGEFEWQSGLMIGCHEMLPAMPELYAGIVEATRGRVAIVALVNDGEEAAAAEQVLSDRQIFDADVHYLQVAHSTMWTRDYGPLVVVDENGRTTLVDADYNEVDRFDDDRVPLAMAGYADIPIVAASLCLEGGNLLSNGQGLLIATHGLFQANAATASERAIADELRRCYGATQLVLLEALAGEPTQHVDMFATFTSGTTVVVGSYDPEADPQNAAILDRNAALLGSVRTPSGPLHVVRIPMPTHHDGVWRTYTNVAYANGILLFPIYPGEDPLTESQAMTTFSQLLPGWGVVGIDATELGKLGGGLHCVTMNLGPFSPGRPFSTNRLVRTGQVGQKMDKRGPRAANRVGYSRS